MGMIEDLASGVKNSLKWQAQSAVSSGISTGISGITSIFKKMKNKCPECHAPIPDESAKFCPNCSANLVLICKKEGCGRESPRGTKFCPTCGSELKADKKA